MQASGVEVASFWPKLFVGAMKGEDMNKLVCSLPEGAGGGGSGVAAPAAGGAAAPAAAGNHLSNLNPLAVSNLFALVHLLSACAYAK